MNLFPLKRKGFSTPELLITMVIFGLLAAALFKFFLMKDNQGRSAERVQEAFTNLIVPIESLRADIKNAHTLNFSTTPSTLTVMYDSLSGTLVSDTTVVWKMDLCSSAPCLTRTVAGGATLTFPGVSALNWCLGSAITMPSCPSYFSTLVPPTTTSTDKLLLADFTLSGTFEQNGNMVTKIIPFAIDIDSRKSDGSTKRNDVRVLRNP